MASIFTRIVQGEIPAYKIAENDDYLAFLDAFPLALGHTLVIPKKEIDYIFDMPMELYSPMWDFAARMAVAIKKAVPCIRVGVSVIGLEVPHTHIHLIPLNSMEDINFSRPKLKFSPDEMERVAGQIRAQL